MPVSYAPLPAYTYETRRSFLIKNLKSHRRTHEEEDELAHITLATLPYTMDEKSYDPFLVPLSESKSEPNNDPYATSLVPQPQPTVWTFAAKMFMLLISLFVLCTVVPLMVIMILQWTAATDYNTRVSDTPMWGNWLLQPQAILCEFVLLGTAYHAIQTRNLVFIIAILCFNIYLVLAGFLEAAQRQPDLLNAYSDSQGAKIPKLVVVNGLLWAVPAIDLCFHLGCDWAAWRLYRELGWLAYQKTSADVRLAKLYHNVLILRSLAFFTTVFAFIELYTTLALSLGAYALGRKLFPSLPPATAQIAGTNALAGVTVLCWTVGLYPLVLALRTESKKWMWISLGVQVGGLGGLLGSVAVLVLLLDQVFDQPDLSIEAAGSSTNLWKTYLQFGVAASLHLATISYSIIVLRGFGQGLKEREFAVEEGVLEHRAEKVDLSG